MKSQTMLLALFSAVAMSGCGGSGGGDSEVAAPAPASAPAPVAPPALTAPAGSPATSAANCPTGVQTFSLTDSTLAGANTTIKNASTTLSFKTPLTATTVKVCVVQKVTGEFPATPEALAAVLTGSAKWVVLADGQFDLLTNKQLIVNHEFSAATPAQNQGKKLVSYTQAGNGAWVRTELSTTQKPGLLPVPADAVSIELTAPITAPGFFTVE